SPALPAGLSISSTTGTISGTPTTASAATNYTVTATNGCSSTTATVNITVQTAATTLSYTIQNPTYCTGNTIASNSPTTNAGGTKTYSVTPALPAGLSLNTSTGVITGTPTTVTATANYVVTVSNGCSSKQTTLSITIIQGMSGLSYTTTPVKYCVNNTITPNTVNTITGGGTITYSVSPALPSGLSISSTTGTISGTPTVTSGATNYTITATNGCSSTTTTVNITVNALPVPSLTSSKDPVCQNDNVTYTTDAGQTNYVWTFSGTSGTDYTIVSGGNSTTNTAVVVWLTSGTKTVTVNYNNSNGCAASTATSLSITVNPIPSGTFAATENSGTSINDNIICAGDAVTFTAPAGYGAYTFYVNGVKVQGPNTSNAYNTTTLNDQDKVTVDVANGYNCGATFGPIAITVNPLPIPTLSADKTSICPGDNVTFTAGGGTNYNFKVNGTSFQSGSSTIYSTTSLANGDVVTVDVSNANSCVATSAGVTMTVYAVPFGTLTAMESSGTPNDNKICAGSNVQFTATAGFSNYNFKVNGSSLQNGPSNTFSSTSLTNGSVVTVDVTNGSGCSATFGPQIITVFALPAGTLTATENSGTANDNIICAGSNVKFTATTGFANYAFYLNGTGAPLYSGSLNTYSTTSLVNNDYVT
ncbi:MAG TPA: putative Ig domain-containing protein, partial [Chitinophagales bacterium]|nr:putative Ig domain-containing protein [Chitinophagales bacterium]